MSSISLCMIVKNEEEKIERCLKSLLPYGFEIIIVDTGSTDNTKEVARKYTPNVYDFSWNDNFSEARNFSLSKASNEWIFVLDSDEWIKSLDVEELLYFMNHLSHAAGAVTRENITGTPENPSLTIDRTERFFSKNKFHYTGMIHEQLTPVDADSFECLLLDSTIKHDGYCMSEEKRTEKSLRNISLLKKQMESDPDNPYVYYQLGKGYEMISDYTTAESYFEKALSFDIDPELAYGQALVVSYGYCLLYTNQIQKALELTRFSSSLSSSADFIYLLGLIYLENKQYDKALDEFEKAMTFEFAREIGANTYLPAYQIGKILLLIGEKETAKEYFLRCGNYQPALDALNTLS